MTNKPALVIMAAGMGSRFGGLKQMAPMDPEGHVICDYSVYDAKRAGFETVVCIIKKEMEADFEDAIGRRIRPHVDLCYAYQELTMLPDGFSVPEGRQKPWGTAHAVLCAAPFVEGNFAVLNADDFYGASAYRAVFDFLSAEHGPTEHALVGYLLANTLSESGSVARGVCEVGADGRLLRVTERLRIEKRPEGPAYTEDGGETWHPLDPNATVSMNLFAYQHGFFDALKGRFSAFLTEDVPKNPSKGEYLLPRVTDQLVQEGRASLQVLGTTDNWHGVTYQQDLPAMREALARMKLEGRYPARLWS
ncbi:MAG: sugar phosphate nucleotidyltransferase [Clostridiales bacterium]|nr:sugar phosphate nucleotidyltransferase [Clostridiales bacterium]